MKKEILISLVLGFLLDCLLGDPHSIPHPVVAIGKMISGLEKLLRRLFPKTSPGEIAAGAVLWVLTVAVSFLVSGYGGLYAKQKFAFSKSASPEGLAHTDRQEHDGPR